LGKESVYENGDLPSRKRYGKARENGERLRPISTRYPFSSPFSSTGKVTQQRAGDGAKPEGGGAMKRRGKRMAALAAAALLLAGGGARANENARFSGGSRDGYDQATANQSGVDLPAFRARLAARSYGGVRDGYAVATAENISMPKSGTVIMIR